MFKSKKRRLSAYLSLIVALLLLTATPATQSALALTPTPSSTFSTICPTPGLKVQPVTSPTPQPSQAIHVSITNGNVPEFSVVARDSAGNILSTTNGASGDIHTQDIVIPLQISVTHYLTVNVRAEVGCTNGQGTPTALTFVNESKTVDVNGNPLVIVQSGPTSTPGITNTPLICPTGTAVYIGVAVEPVTSPTSANSQVVVVSTFGYPATVTVTTASGTFNAALQTDGRYAATVTLLPNTTHNLSVTANPFPKTATPVGTPVTGCPQNGPIAKTVTTDKNGAPLVIVQQTASNDGSPYGGTPRAIPGTVQAEDFNTGGEGVAYHDTDAGNNGGQYRPGEAVDIEPTTDTNGGYNVGWTATGEWEKYTVNVNQSGNYDLTFRVASAVTGGAFHLEVDNVNVTGTLTVPNTGGWQVWTTVTRPGVNLPAGQHIFKLVMDAAGGNFNWFSATPVVTALPDLIVTNIFPVTVGPACQNKLNTVVTVVNNGTASSGAFMVHALGDLPVGGLAAGQSINVTFTGFTGTITAIADSTNMVAESNEANNNLTRVIPTVTAVPPCTPTPFGADGNPFGGTPRSLPGILQAEDYNTGGEGVAYHDTTPGNTGGAYRTDDVDIETTGDTGGGYNIGWVDVGEWTKYTVNMISGAMWTIEFRVASPNSTGKFHLEVDNVNVTGSIAVPNTGGWQTYTSVTRGSFNISGGQHVLKLVTETTGMNFNWMRFNAAMPGVPTNTPTASATCACGGPTATRTPTITPTQPSGVAAWATGIAYSVGTQVTYMGHTYQCIQAHTSQTGWEPPNAPALWSFVS